MILYLLAGIGMVCLTAGLTMAGLLWWHQRIQVKLLRESTKFLETCERVSHGPNNKPAVKEKVGHV